MEEDRIHAGFPILWDRNRIVSDALQFGHQGLRPGCKRLQPVHDVAPHAGIGAVVQQVPHLLALSQPHLCHRRTSLPLGQLVLGVSRGIGCRFPGQLGFQDRHRTFLAGRQLLEQDGKGLFFRIQHQVGQAVGIIAGVVGQDARRQRPFGFRSFLIPEDRGERSR